MADLIPAHIAHQPEHVASFSPEKNSVTTSGGTSISYDALIVAPGLKINWDGIGNLSKTLADPRSGVSSIYSFDTADKVWSDIEALRTGKAIFTQPAGAIKCAGAPQVCAYFVRIPLISPTDVHLSLEENNVDGLGPIPSNSTG